MIRGHRHRTVQRGRGRFEDTFIEPVEPATAGQTDECEADDTHLVDPAGTPSELGADLDGKLDVIGVEPGPRRVVAAVGARRDEVDVGSKSVDGETPRHERPRIGPFRVVKTRPSRPSRPGIEIVETFEEPERSASSQALGLLRAVEPSDVVEIAGQQADRDVRLDGDSRREHHVSALAYSSAIRAGDTCT